MKKIFLLLTVVVSFLFSDVYVNGYYKKNGTYVEPHYRSSPNDTKSDNWSTKGNINPYTNEEGTKTYDDYHNYGRNSGNSNYYSNDSYDNDDNNYYSKYGIYSSNDCIKMDFDSAIDDCVNYFMGENQPKNYQKNSSYNDFKEKDETPFYLHIIMILVITFFVIGFVMMVMEKLYEWFSNSVYDMGKNTMLFLLILTTIVYFILVGT